MWSQGADLGGPKAHFPFPFLSTLAQPAEHVLVSLYSPVAFHTADDAAEEDAAAALRARPRKRMAAEMTPYFVSRDRVLHFITASATKCPLQKNVAFVCSSSVILYMCCLLGTVVVLGICPNGGRLVLVHVDAFDFIGAPCNEKDANRPNWLVSLFPTSFIRMLCLISKCQSHTPLCILTTQYLEIWLKSHFKEHLTDLIQTKVSMQYHMSK